MFEYPGLGRVHVVYDVSSMGAVVSAVAAVIAVVTEVVEVIVDVVEVAFVVAETVKVVADTVDYFVGGDSTAKNGQSNPETEGANEINDRTTSTEVGVRQGHMLGPDQLEEYLERATDID